MYLLHLPDDAAASISDYSSFFSRKTNRDRGERERIPMPRNVMQITQLQMLNQSAGGENETGEQDAVSLSLPSRFCISIICSNICSIFNCTRVGQEQGQQSKLLMQTHKYVQNRGTLSHASCSRTIAGAVSSYLCHVVPFSIFSLSLSLIPSLNQLPNRLMIA